MKRTVFAISLSVIVVLSGCDWTDTAPVERQVVVESYLLAGGRLPFVRLTWSSPVSGVYLPELNRILGATVRVDRLEDDGAVLESYPFHIDPGPRGEYEPIDRPIVVPGARYRLEVVLESGERITSTTRVPGTFSVLAVSSHVATHEGEQIELTVSRSNYPGRQSYLILTTQAFRSSYENATPITRRILDENENLTPAELAVTSSPAINETTYQEEPDGPLVIPIPWLAIRFYGQHWIRVSAVDDNLYDFTRSHLVQQGGSTFLPGEVPNILDHVDGGTGVFGSYADVAVVVQVRESDEAAAEPAIEDVYGFVTGAAGR